MSPWMAAKILAVKRRLALGVTGRFDPFPLPPAGAELSPSGAHFAAYDAAPLALSWQRAGIADARAWQAAARAKLAEIAGYARDRPVPESRFETDVPTEAGFSRRKVYLRVREGSDVPVTVVRAEGASAPLPVMICLQGTNSGAHLSWGEARMPADPLDVANGKDYARQAAARGYAAVCIEQACFGERRERALARVSSDPCIDAANHALLLGRTLLGERTSDVSSVIDWLVSDLDAFDVARVHVMGNSSGGTTAVFAAALDDRIGAVLAGGCVGFIRDNPGRNNDPAGQNVIPAILNWFEYDDVVALVAPRPFVAVNGDRDHIWPFDTASAVIERARPVYQALGASEALRAVRADGGHRFYPDLAWENFSEAAGPV